MDWHEQREALLAAARVIVDRAKAADRDLTQSEIDIVNDKVADAKALAVRIKQSASAAAAVEALGRLPGTPSGTKEFIALGGDHGATMAARLTSKIRAASETVGTKALLGTGVVATPTELTYTDPIALGVIPESILSVIPMIRHAEPRFAYLRQTTRTNNAATVAIGAVKPTSVYSLTRVEADLKVVAHLSEPIDKFWLADAPSLERFVRLEMLYGLQLALEAQVVSGDGTGTNMTGILNTSGIQLQAAVGTGDAGLFTTTRTAVTALETAGGTPRVFVLHPSAWQRLELSRNTSGNFDLGQAPVDRAARKLWGVQVVVSTAVSALQALLLDTNDLAVDADDAGVEVRWSEAVSDDFSRNQLRCRAESRWNLSVFRPLSVVRITLPAAA